jgi:methionyl-tRNA formyltransferase
LIGLEFATIQAGGSIDMASNDDYKLLLLTSDPTTIAEVTEIARRNFKHVTVLYWEMGNLATKPELVRQIEATDYNLIISYINGIILKRHHLQKAHFGAINIHPAPPEHGGCWGIWCQPVIRRDFRTHHGVTAHEIDEAIDHGPIYRVWRWEVGADETIQSVFENSCAKCLEIFAEVAAELGKSSNGTQCFTRLDEQWHPTNRHTPLEDIRRWFRELDPAHPAHLERVWFNHPRAIITPPYFDDI